MLFAGMKYWDNSYLVDYLDTPFVLVSLLVRLAYYYMEKDMEMSCDEAVLRSLGLEERKHYAQTLLALSKGRMLLSGIFLP